MLAVPKKTLLVKELANPSVKMTRTEGETGRKDERLTGSQPRICLGLIFVVYIDFFVVFHPEFFSTY